MKLEFDNVTYVHLRVQSDKIGIVLRVYLGTRDGLGSFVRSEGAHPGGLT